LSTILKVNCLFLSTRDLHNFALLTDGMVVQGASTDDNVTHAQGKLTSLILSVPGLHNSEISKQVELLCKEQQMIRRGFGTRNTSVFLWCSTG
jgi:hypothetical protein